MSVAVPATLYACLGSLVGNLTQTLPPAAAIWVTIPICLATIGLFMSLSKAIRRNGDLRLQRIYSRRAQPPENVYIKFPDGKRLALETKFEHYDSDSGTYVWEVEITPELAFMIAADQARIKCEKLPDDTVLHMHATGGDIISINTQSGEQ